MLGITSTRASSTLCLLDPNMRVHYIGFHVSTCTNSSLRFLVARHGLTSMPNNSKLLYRSNATIKASLGGFCGCRALASGGVHILENEPRGVPDALSFEHPAMDSKKQKRWEEQGLSLLFEA